MKPILIFFSITLLSFVLSCNTSNDKSKHDAINSKQKIPNGLYLVLNEFEDSTSKTAKGIIIPFNHDLLDDDEYGQKTFVEIDTSEFVKFDLTEEPVGEVQADKRINLLLTLSDSGKTQLANFTEKHLNQKVAIVLGGSAVTRHKVKSKIEGGKLQISRCTESGCKYLLVTLKESLKK